MKPPMHLLNCASCIWLLLNLCGVTLAQLTLTASLPQCVVLVAVIPFLSCVTTEKVGPLIRVTDDNWKIVLEGEWMVKFMAPWCPACRSLQSTWQSLAEWSQDLDIDIGMVDVTENPGLSGRFLVTALPTILHVKDGEFRTYRGPRKESDLTSFVEDKKWQEVDPMSAWIHPNSLQMGAVGFFFKIAMWIRNLYNVMTTEYGIPELVCYIIFTVITLIVGLFLGLIFVLCCDCLFPPKYVPAYKITGQDVEDDKDDESDVIEDVGEDKGENGEEGDTTVRRRQKGGEEESEKSTGATSS